MHTHAHVHACMRAPHTPPRVPSLSFPSLSPASQLLGTCGCCSPHRPFDHPLGCSSPGLAPPVALPHPHIQPCLEGPPAPCEGQTKETSEVGAPMTSPTFLSLQQLMKKHSTQARPDPASEREQPQVCGDLQPGTSPSTVTARPRWGPRWAGHTTSQGGRGRVGCLEPVAATRAAGAATPVLFPTDHTQCWAERLLQPCRVPRTGFGRRRTSQLLQVRVGRHCPLSWGRQRSLAFGDTPPPPVGQALPSLSLLGSAPAVCILPPPIFQELHSVTFQGVCAPVSGAALIRSSRPDLPLASPSFCLKDLL